MIKPLVFVLCTLTSITSYSKENWQLLVDGDKGSRLIVDLESLNVDTYGKDKALSRIHVVMKVVTSKGSTESFISAIDGGQCIANQAGTIVNVFSDGSSSEYFWSADGDKLYDVQGKFLCFALTKAIETTLKKETKSPMEYM